ncbi:Carbon monoxide dehydrogenase medium chain [Baekduia alba]|uniref:FAD binding domain-containing protein n=1 Tax=Baekduia alba TaxID=2997333 RepID=UPI0023405DD1|nr:xanthine dehydrogenase family protein subunit M [Baekduia alba]WCB94114.1 Carbon monoxide dehydrogenase medium chain [Baekduia alba]
MQIPAAFEYERATSVEHALELLRSGGPDARLLAGGHSLLPMMKLRLAAPELLIDLDALSDELGYVREADGEVRIGALTRHREILESALIAARFGVFIDAEKLIADPVVRNRGTIGGALCQADPAEDISAACAVVGARLVIQGLDGQRTISMRELHSGPYETTIRDAEMLVEIRVPVQPGIGSAYEKVKRRVGDWAIAAVAAAVRLDGGTIASGAVALTAVGGDVTAQRASDALTGAPPSEETFAQAARLAAEDCAPQTDQRGSAEYKRHLANELTLRALRSATARALREES